MPSIEISLEQIAQTEALTNSLIDSIPPSVYFEKSTAERLKKSKHKTINEKVKDAKLSKQEKHKLAKLDPKINVPISQILDNLDAKGEESNDESEEEDENTDIQKPKRKNRKRKNSDKLENQSKRLAIEQSEQHKTLKEKLNQRLAEMKAKRELSGKNVDKKKKLKMEKQTVLKAKKEQRKDQMKKKIKEKVKEKKEKRGEPITIVNKTENPKKIPKVEKIKTEIKAEKKQNEEKKVKTETTDEITEKPKKVKLNLEFNQTIEEEEEDSEKTKKKKKLKFTHSNPHDNLAQLEKSKRQMQKLQEKDPEKAKAVKEQQLWAKAINKAKGIKIRDDEMLLKSSIRKRELLKKRSKKKWDKRIGGVKKQQKERQEKRNANIQKRKDEKLKRKIKKRK